MIEQHVHGVLEGSPMRVHPIRIKDYFMQEVSEYVTGAYSYGLTDEEWFQNCIDSVTAGKERLSLKALRMYPEKENLLAVAGLMCKQESRSLLLALVRVARGTVIMASRGKDWGYLLYLYFNASMATGREHSVVRWTLQEGALGPWYVTESITLNRSTAGLADENALRDLAVYVSVSLCAYEDVLIYPSDLELVFDQALSKADVRYLASRFQMPNVNITYDMEENALLFEKGPNFSAPGNYYSVKVAI